MLNRIEYDEHVKNVTSICKMRSKASREEMQTQRQTNYWKKHVMKKKKKLKCAYHSGPNFMESVMISLFFFIKKKKIVVQTRNARTEKKKI